MKKKSVLLIGLGRFGRHVALKLNELGHEVMAVDRNEERVNDLLFAVTDGVIGDSTGEEFLRSLDVENYDLCFVTIGNDFQSSLETTCLLKELGAKFVVSRAERDGQAKLLLRNGADKIVYPEKQMAYWTAMRYSAEHILDYIEVDGSFGIFEVLIPEDWLGKSIGEIDIRKKYHFNLLAIRREGKIDAAISPDTVLRAGETMLVLGEYERVQKYFKL